MHSLTTLHHHAENVDKGWSYLFFHHLQFLKRFFSTYTWTHFCLKVILTCILINKIKNINIMSWNKIYEQPLTIKLHILVSPDLEKVTHQIMFQDCSVLIILIQDIWSAYNIMWYDIKKSHGPHEVPGLYTYIIYISILIYYYLVFCYTSVPILEILDLKGHYWSAV